MIKTHALEFDYWKKTERETKLHSLSIVICCAIAIQPVTLLARRSSRDDAVPNLDTTNDDLNIHLRDRHINHTVLHLNDA